MKYTREQVREFIKESNAIEDVWTEEAIEDSYDSWLYLTEVMTSDTLTLLDILVAHQGILARLEPKYAGKLRGEIGVDVFIGGHKAPDYWNVGSKLCDWIRHVNQIKEWDAETIKRFHISFEDIHPFGDGNGRVGRLIYLWMREKSGLPIHIIYEKDKQEYYEWFRR